MVSIPKNQIISVYATFPSEALATAIAKGLLEQKLVACCNVFPVQSLYTWNGEIQEDAECALIAKSLEVKWLEIENYIATKHEYDCPCIIKSEVVANRVYSDWVEGVLKA